MSALYHYCILTAPDIGMAKHRSGCVETEAPVTTLFQYDHLVARIAERFHEDPKSMAVISLTRLA